MTTKLFKPNSCEQSACPDCGNQDVVSKAVAWDALSSLSPKIKKELNELRSLRMAVIDLLSFDHLKDRRENTVLIPVPADLLGAVAHNPQVDRDGVISRLSLSR